MIKQHIYFLTIIIFLSAILSSCRPAFRYTGDIDLTKHQWLKDKKIFLDPGHGGKGERDRFRIGPGGTTEEEINLRVALILKEMLKRAGADVIMSREKDVDISLDQRVGMVEKAQPHLFVSLHHNGTARRVDDVNYPCVLIWGCKEVRPLGYAFAEMLLDEFHKIMDQKGHILSDFAIYTETGTRVLRETRYTCPGVIGEPGFFSNENFEKALNDYQYNQAEAEAYFKAISRFFERGIPGAIVFTSSTIDNSTYFFNLLNSDRPEIKLKLDSGLPDIGINEKSIKITLDHVPVGCKKLTEDVFLVQYGKKLYPGGHSLRFTFSNRRGQPSMIYRTGFTIKIKKGDYGRLVSSGIKKVRQRWSAKDGLKMLMPALSMGVTDPNADRVIWNIAKGFTMIGDKANADYYYAKLYYFYPHSSYRDKVKWRFSGYRYPVNYLGKLVDIKHESADALKTLFDKNNDL